MLSKRIIQKVVSIFRIIRLRRINGLYLGNHVVFKGSPIIDIRNGGKVIIADGVTINSENAGYHINMYTSTKLYADVQGAIITIGEKSRIHGSCLHAFSSISIGKRCLIAANCQIIDGNGHDLSFNNVENRINTQGLAQPITIEDDVWIGANSIILPGVTIGKGSVIGAGSVVTGDIPSMVLAAGNPAKPLRKMCQYDLVCT